MKIIIVILALMVETAIASANTIIDPTFIETNLVKNEVIVLTIHGNTGFPEGYTVGVEFELNDCGRIKVTHITGDPVIAGLVKTKIESIDTENLQYLAGEKFNYNLVFRSESDV